MHFTPTHFQNDQHNSLQISYPHVGMRKVKSIIAIFVGFCLWQTLRLFLPELEVHPLFIYIYGMIEIRETSDKTMNYGRMRIKATFTAIGMGLPLMALMDYFKVRMKEQWMKISMEIILLLIGALLVLIVAEIVKCQVYCGLAAAIYIILMVSHIDSSMYLYSVMRAFQTIIGVAIAWVINVKLLPYPPKPGSLSYYLMTKAARKKEARKEKMED